MSELQETNDDLYEDPFDGDTMWRFTEWGCLRAILGDYGIEIPEYITSTIGKHMVNDFMNLMCKHGYVSYVSDDKEEKNDSD